MTAAAIPDALRPRLGQFVRLLASDQPGEVMAATAALKRALASVGADLNDLGDAIGRPAERVVVAERREPPPPRRRAGQGCVPLDLLRARKIAGALNRASASGALSSWEESFITSVLPTLQGYVPRLTARQMEVVERLVSKHGEFRAWA